MENIRTLYAGGIISPEQKQAFERLGDAMADLVEQMHDAGVPQGLIVGWLHGLAVREAVAMMTPEA